MNKMAVFEVLTVACRPSSLIVPLVLPTITIVLFGGLAIETAIRSGSEGYFTFYQIWLPHEGAAGNKIELSHPPVSDLTRLHSPFQI